MKMFSKSLLHLIILFTFIAGLSVSTEAAVGISKKSATVWVGDSLTLKINGVSASKVKWSSNKPAVAKVNAKGFVKALKAGSAVITAKAGTKSWSCKLTVKSLPVISAKTATLRVGDNLTLKVNGVSAASVKWSSSKKAVATVTSKGIVKAVKTGSADIVAKVGSKTFKCNLTVKKAVTTTTTTTATRTSTGSGTADTSQATVVDTSVAGGGITYSVAGLGAEEARVFKVLYGMMAQWPEGMTYTNDDYYMWKGGIYRGGYGCAGFAFMMSDAAFGDELAVMHYNFRSMKVGDILRLDYDAHSVIIMKVEMDGVVVAEGNFDKKIHWGRFISFNEIMQTGTNVITRYGSSTIGQKAKVRKMRDSLPILF